jgi:hypothetical protein
MRVWTSRRYSASVAPHAGQPLRLKVHATAPITRRTRAVRRRRPRSSSSCFRRVAICSGVASGPSSVRTSLIRAARSESALQLRQSPALVRRLQRR